MTSTLYTGVTYVAHVSLVQNERQKSMKFLFNIRKRFIEIFKDPLEALNESVSSNLNSSTADLLISSTLLFWNLRLFMNPFEWHSVDHFPPKVTSRDRWNHSVKHDLITKSRLAQSYATFIHTLDVSQSFVHQARLTGRNQLRNAPKRSALELALRSHVDRSRPG